MTTEQDLREVMAAHADDAPENPERLAQVRIGVRVATNRRRRIGVLLAAAVVLAVVVPVVTRHPARRTVHGDFLTPGELASGSRPGPPSPTPSPMVVNPEYAGGGRRIGAGAATSPAHGTLTYTFTPTSYQLYLTTTCTDPQTSLATVVDGHEIASGGCSGGLGAPADAVVSRAEWGREIVLGRPNTVSITIIAGADGVGVHPLSASQRRPGTIASAIYQAVPFDAYPLPPRPAALAAFNGNGIARVLMSARTPPNGSFTATFVVQPQAVDGQLGVSVIGPGVISIAVSGRRAITLGNYDWHPGGTDIDVSPSALSVMGIHAVVGQRLTATITASHFTGPYWQAYEGS